jgi:hypothetical protein
LNGKIGIDDRRAMEQLIAEVRRTAQGEDVTAIRDVMERLQQASYRLSEGAAGGAEAQPGHWESGSGGNGRDAVPGADEGEDVVEGEFRQA